MGIYPFSTTQAWVVTYPDEQVRVVNLAKNTLSDNQDPPRITGPLIPVEGDTQRLYAGSGGFGPAALAEINPTLGEIKAVHDLASGSGPVSCAEFAR